MTNLLVISPHPDDETLGAGGTLLKCKNQGKKIHWLNITNMKSEYGYDNNKIAERNIQIEKVKKMYEIDGFYDLELEPSSLDRYPKSKLVQEISKVIEKVKPTIIILPYSNDIHSDHKVVFECAYSCTKSFRYPYIKTVLCMEVPSETDFASTEQGFVPNYFINIEDFLKKKLEIMKVYKSELGSHPFPRSLENIEALAIIRGASSGVRYAEGFKLVKHIE